MVFENKQFRSLLSTSRGGPREMSTNFQQFSISQMTTYRKTFLDGGGTLTNGALELMSDMIKCDWTQKTSQVRQEQIDKQLLHWRTEEHQLEDILHQVNSKSFATPRQGFMAQFIIPLSSFGPILGIQYFLLNVLGVPNELSLPVLTVLVATLYWWLGCSIFSTYVRAVARRVYDRDGKTNSLRSAVLLTLVFAAMDFLVSAAVQVFAVTLSLTGTVTPSIFIVPAASAMTTIALCIFVYFTVKARKERLEAYALRQTSAQFGQDLLDGDTASAKLTHTRSQISKLERDLAIEERDERQAMEDWTQHHLRFQSLMHHSQISKHGCTEVIHSEKSKTNAQMKRRSLNKEVTPDNTKPDV